MKFICTGVDASMILTDRCLGADSKTQVDRIFFNTATKRIYAIRRCSAEDLQMQAEIVVWKREVGICRCGVADVKTQVEINFLQTPTTLIVSIFSLRAAGQCGLMSRKRNPVARHVDRHTLRSNCNVGLSWANPFPRNASRPSKAVVKL